MPRAITITTAVEALLEDVERRLCARPAFWRGSGEALVLHGGSFYRLAPGLEPLDGPSYPIGSSEIIGRWHVLPIAEVRLEPVAELEPLRRRVRAKKPGVERRERRGRPSAEELRAELPESDRDSWLGIAEAAKEVGVGKDKLRRSVAAGELAVRRVRGVSFVELRAVRELARAAPAAPAIESEEAFS